MAQLIIDGYEIELGESKLVFSKSGYSFEDWLTKDIPYSERITLPETSLLNSIFKRPNSPDIYFPKFSKFHTFKYKDNGKIVFSGVCKLLSFNENKEYEIQLLDSSFDLFENLNNDLTALSLDSYDFTFNSASYNTLKVLTSSIWLWCASSMHEDKILANNVLSGNLRYSRPFFSIKRLIELMFSTNGWTYELGTYADEFDKLFISAKSEFVFTSFEVSYSTTLAASVLDLSGYSFLQTDSLTGTTILNTTYKSRIRFRGNAIADNDFILQITVGGTKSQVQQFILNQGEDYYDLTSNEFDAGSTIYFTLIGTGNVEFTNFLIYTIIDENDFGAMSSGNFIGMKVKTYDNIPDLEQKELFKHALVSIGGFFTTNNFNKKLKINSLKSLSKLGVIDWSDKFVEDTDSIMAIEGYAKNNYYAYDNSDIKPTNLGRGLFQIDDETLQDKTDIYESIFEASPEVTITDLMIDNTIYDNTERLNDIGILLAYYEVISSTYTAARFENLNGNTVLSNYYANFVKAIQSGEIIEAKFNLNKSDFFLFDFTKLVYLSQKKSIFYVLNIGNYSDGDLTDVVLLKT